jgi:hypothetical protein
MNDPKNFKEERARELAQEGTLFPPLALMLGAAYSYPFGATPRGERGKRQSTASKAHRKARKAEKKRRKAGRRK